MLTSDSLHLVSLYQDIFVDKYPIRSWNLPSPPYFFPDMTLFIPLLRATADIGHGFVLYTILFYFPILLILAAIAYTVYEDWFWCFVCVFSVGLLFVAISQERAYLYPLYEFFYPNYHAGQLLSGFALVAIFIRSSDKGYSWMSAGSFLLLACLTIASDLLIVPQFLIPMIITSCVFFLLRLIPLSAFATTSILSAAAYILASIMLLALRTMGVFNIASSFDGFSLDAGIFLQNALGFLRDMRSFYDSHPVFFFMFFTAVITSGLQIAENRHHFLAGQKGENSSEKSQTPLLILLVFSVISAIGTIVGPIAINRWVAVWCVHYLQVLYVLPILLISIFLVSHIIKGSLWPKMIILLTAIVSIYMILTGTRALEADGLSLPYPKSVQRLDKLSKEHGFRYGYGYYWHAKFITVFSREGVRVNQLDKNLGFFQWMNNNAWYCSIPGGNNAKYPKYEFILVTPSTRQTVAEKFGKPAAVEYCDGLEVHLYDRKSDVAFRNFLRVPALMINDRDLPASPSSPEYLSLYKPDGSASSAPGNLEIPADGDVSIQFDPPARGEIIEFAADSDGEYLLHFLAKDKPIDTLTVPKGAGAGLKIRYLLLPESIKEEPFDTLVIHNLASVGATRVGHIFIYDDTN